MTWWNNLALFFQAWREEQDRSSAIHGDVTLGGYRRHAKTSSRGRTRLMRYSYRLISSPDDPCDDEKVWVIGYCYVASDPGIHSYTTICSDLISITGIM
jgi:hypothetical protein